MASSVTAGRNLYWDIAARRAADFFRAASTPGNRLLAVLPVLHQHATEFGLHTTTDVAQMVLAAVVHEDCPGDSRTPQGAADLDRLVPTGTDPMDVLTAADAQQLLFGTPLAEGITGAEEQATAAARARAAIQDALNVVTQGTAGRVLMIERFWELRDDPRALIAVSILTAAAVRAVTADRPVERNCPRPTCTRPTRPPTSPTSSPASASPWMNWPWACLRFA
ncbi:hypothetical protein ABZX39_15155 [Streptomyces collinus]|uniref:hypothetical protein n=1 Tax=Streptomyces collinus TaxID=42684 RepID=UPI0033BB637C